MNAHNDPTELRDAFAAALDQPAATLDEDVERLAQAHALLQDALQQG